MHSRIDITQIPDTDQGVWDMIAEGRVKGCFQIEAHLGKTWGKALKPRSILDLAALISIIRPGTLKAFVDGKSMTQHYIDRRDGKDEVPSLHPSIDDVLKETYGVVVYQEQAMEISVKMAGFNLKEADDLRKAIGKKKVDLMKQVRVKFIQGSIANGIHEAKAIEVFDIIEKSARYSFNKSHAVGYAMVSYWSAYTKYHLANKFFKNWLRGADDKIDPDAEVRQLILAAKLEGLTIKGPTFRSLEENFHWKDDAIFFGICNIKNVGKQHLESLSSKLAAINDQVYWLNILVNVLMDVNKKAVENMISVGVFSGLGLSRTQMLHEFSCLSELTDKELDAVKSMVLPSHNLGSLLDALVSRGTKKNGGFISTEARLKKVSDLSIRVKNPGRSLSDNSSIYARIEENLLGYSINHSELLACADACHSDTTCSEIINGKTSKSTLAVVLKIVKTHKTKKGDTMAFLSVEDDSAELENVVIFPDVYEGCKDIIYEKATVLISGEIKDRQKGSFIVDKVFLI